MIGLGRRVPMFGYGEVADMGESFDTLAAIVRERVGRDVLAGVVYVFVGRARRGAKVSFWDDTGLCALAKRLSKGRFAAA